MENYVSLRNAGLLGRRLKGKGEAGMGANKNAELNKNQ